MFLVEVLSPLPLVALHLLVEEDEEDFTRRMHRRLETLEECLGAEEPVTLPIRAASAIPSLVFMTVTYPRSWYEVEYTRKAVELHDCILFESEFIPKKHEENKTTAWRVARDDGIHVLEVPSVTRERIVKFLEDGEFEDVCRVHGESLPNIPLLHPLTSPPEVFPVQQQR